MTFKIQLECYCHCGVVLGPIPFPSLMPSNSGDDQHPSLFFDNSLLGLLWRHRLVLPKTAKKKQRWRGRPNSDRGSEKAWHGLTMAPSGPLSWKLRTVQCSYWLHAMHHRTMDRSDTPTVGSFLTRVSTDVINGNSCVNFFSKIRYFQF